MKKILYLMNVNWNWIKQRPQYIAEGLSKKYQIFVMYKHSYNNKDYQHRNSDLVHIKEIFCIPNKFSNNKLARKINKLIFSHEVKKNLRKNDISIIYVTSPHFYEMIPKEYKGKIIYDCMDDHINLENYQRKITFKEEKRLLNICDKVLVTSIHLKKILLKRYGDKNKKKFVLVRNGFQGPILNNSKVLHKTINKAHSRLKIAYFGTISRWLDFDLIQKSLDDFSNIDYRLIGPVNSSIKIPQSNRIHLYGTVEHDQLYKSIVDCDILIMPFKLNEMIKSVDPVKLYEYINFYKNIISVKYTEIERFSHFVHFYSNYEDYKKLLLFFERNHRITYSLSDRKKFLENNTWNKRVEQIEKAIE